MPDLQKVHDTKDRIISIIRLNGPSYPAKIAREAELSPLFASAFLSELVSERKLKISDMKVGSSPIYYTPGQEELLENFSSYLGSKEKEAFHKIKESLLLEDDALDPGIRVALRKIKDFANPLNVRINDETRLFWKYFTVSEDEAKERLRKVLSKPEKETMHPEAVKEKKEEIKEDKKEEKTRETFEEHIKKEKPLKKVKIEEPGEFVNSIKGYLKSKDIEVIEEVMSKKKEYAAKVRADTLFGKQEFYLTSKDKKKISQTDLTMAIQKAQTEKMPALFLSQGELDKKALEYLNEWKNVLKIGKLG